MLHTREQRAAAALALFTAAYGVATARAVKERREREQRDHPKVQRTPSASKPQDHPLAAWVLSNGPVLALSLLQRRLLGSLDPQKSSLQLFLKIWGSGVVIVDGMMLVNWVLVNKVYAHVPFFSEKHAKQTPGEIAWDYIRTNTIVNIVTSALQVFLFRVMRKSEAGGDPPGAPFRPLRFLARMFWMRACVDVGFWAGHAVLHDKRFYWLHKRHHEHNNVQLSTNYHFDWRDLLVEGFLPFFLGAFGHELCFGPLPEAEINTLMAYTFWFEIESHSGKPMPTMQLIPPLAPLMTRFDDWNSWFHEVHHRVLKSNLSISPWFDVIMGTDRWDV